MRRAIVNGGLILVLTGEALAGDVSKGQALFAARCSFCHGPEGKGDGPVGAALKPPPTNLASSEYWRNANLQRVREVLKNGKSGTAMPPSQLSAEEIEDVVAYLETLPRK
ncbi:MAG TPA: cytochrome c [Candidatus Binatia bacterium]|nr:cytochrome c [Candidatus Binatia bacterium]